MKGKWRLNNQLNIKTLQENLSRLQVSGVTAGELLEQKCLGMEVGVTATGHPFLRAQGQPLYQEDDTLAVVKQEALGLLQGEPAADLVVFFGLGLGLHLEFLRQNTSAPIIVYEPDSEAVATVLGQIPLMLDCVKLVTNIGQLGELVQDYLGRPPCHMVVGVLPGWAKQQMPAFEEFKRTLQQAVRKVQSDRLTRSVFSAEWVNNMAANLPFLAPRKHFSVLGRRFAGKPAILVGAGPSLDRNMADLARAKDRALILAVHSAVVPLSKAGITPDLVIILEGQKLDHYFKDVPELSKIVLVPSPQTHPVHLTLGFKDFLTMSHEGNAAADWLQQAYGEKPLRTGGSVACAAFSLLHELGCDPLVLVGMDTAYSDTQGHAKNNEIGCCQVVFAEDNQSLTTRCRRGLHDPVTYLVEQVPSWGGGEKVFTRSVLTGFRNWFEAAARSWADDCQVINATEGGARFEGFQEKTLVQVLDEYCKDPFSATEEITKAMVRAENRDPTPLIKTVRQELGFIRKAAEAARVVDATSLQAIRKLKSGQLQTVQPLLDKLSGNESSLRDATKKTRLLNTMVGHRAQDLAEEKSTGDKVALTIHSIQQSRRISNLVVEGSEELLALFEPALSALENGK